MGRRNATVGGRRTPSPPTSPPGPDHTHSEHAVSEEPITDFDGPGVDEQKQVDSPIFTVVRERYTCRREGCEASGGANHLYTLESLSERVKQAMRYAIRDEGWHSGDITDEDLCEYAAMNNTVIDWDGNTLILGISFGSGTITEHDTLGYVYPEESVDRGDLGGECHGKPQRPDPEGQWRDI